MLYMRLSDPFEAVTLNQFDNPAKTGLHVEWQDFKFVPNAVVKQLYDPRHSFTVLHFCNTDKENLVTVVLDNLDVADKVMVASNPNLLNLLQSEHIRGPVVELGGPRGGVGGDGLRLLDRPAVFQVGGNSGGAEGMAAG